MDRIALHILGEVPFCPCCGHSFWSRVRRDSSGCWVWTGTQAVNGYGHWPSGQRGRALLAHRVAWELVNGPIPDGMSVLHHCDKPPCVNPEHLWLGTHAQNMADMARKGRSRSTKLIEEQVLSIRARANESHRALGREFGVSKTTITSIIARRIWRHL